MLQCSGLLIHLNPWCFHALLNLNIFHFCDLLITFKAPLRPRWLIFLYCFQLSRFLNIFKTTPFYPASNCLIDLFHLKQYIYFSQYVLSHLLGTFKWNWLCASTKYLKIIQKCSCFKSKTTEHFPEHRGTPDVVKTDREPSLPKQ